MSPPTVASRLKLTAAHWSRSPALLRMVRAAAVISLALITLHAVPSEPVDGLDALVKETLAEPKPEVLAALRAPTQAEAMAALVGTWTFSPCNSFVTNGFTDTLILHEDGTYTDLHTVFDDASCVPRALISRVDGTYHTAFAEAGGSRLRITLTAFRATPGADGNAPQAAVTPPIVISGHYEINGDVLGLSIDADSRTPDAAYSKLIFPYTKH